MLDAQSHPSNAFAGQMDGGHGAQTFQLPRVIEGGVGVNNLKPPQPPPTVLILPTSHGNEASFPAPTLPTSDGVCQTNT